MTGREVALAFAAVIGVVVIAVLGRRLGEMRLIAELERDEAARRRQLAERLETEVRDARIAAAVSQQRAGFLSAISHNLRTPLTSIKAAASTLLSSWSRLEVEERRELVELIYDESDRL
ncbi:MAG TPA: histidine kinase dimerization/phospho-acceptor domain-containing protein, partial [Acidimicrobiia bacterium]|nr:histidine kinase dimerization/phospho-acceptor domain-containing protein [Acidimicrobiia bacterium]